jgi:hypothetical protein
MDLRTLKNRIDRLLETQGPPDGPPECVVLLPENGRGPDSDAPYPRVQRVGRVVVITYLGEQPSRDEIEQLLKVRS